MKAVEFSKAARKQLLAIEKTQRLRILAKIEQYAAAPSSLAGQVTRLQGEPYLRLRVGDYRVIFDEDGTVIMIVAIGHRREIYR